MYSVDWLTMAQQHPPGTVPDLGDGAFLRVTEDGEVERVTAISLRVPGSYATGIMIRSFGGLVEIDGNPSRWGRAENVFGLSLLDALALYNEILELFDLPPFTASTVRPSGRSGSDQESRLAIPVSDGAVVRRIDVCRNFATGEDPQGLQSVCRALGQGVWQGEAGRVIKGTTYWGSERSQVGKIYAKAPEIREHGPKGKSLNDWTPDDLTYRERVAEWAEQVGLLRWEVRIGRDGLRRRGMRSLSALDWDQMVEDAEVMRNKIFPGTSLGGLGGIADELVSQGIGERQAAQLQALAFEWASGRDVFGQFKPPTAYRYAKILRGVGVDIRKPLRDVTTLRVQPRVVDLQPARIPDWYRRAA